MSLPGPLVYFSYSFSIPGRTSNLYSNVTIKLPPLFLSSRPDGCSLAEERGDPFLGIDRHGVHRHDLLGIRVRFRLVEVDLRVKGLLPDGERDGARLRDARRELPGFLTERARGHDAVDEPPLRRRPRVDRIPGQKHPEGALAADGAGQRDHRSRAEEPDPDAWGREPGVFGRDREVARRHELASGRGGETLNLGDDRLRNRLDLRHQLGADVEDLTGVVDVPSDQLAEIVPRAVSLSGRGEDDGAELPVLSDASEAVQQLPHECQREGVAPRGAIQRHDGDGPVRLEAEALVSHLTPPFPADSL